MPKLRGIGKELRTIDRLAFEIGPVCLSVIRAMT